MGRALTATLWSALVLLIMIVLASAGLRVAVDWPNITAGIMPPNDSPDHGYALHPILAYAHILTGVVYLVGAPFQLSRGFRERHFTVHRRLGRILLPAGITAGIFAIIYGTLIPYGGLLEASATVVFGVYFIAALVTAFLAIKRGDVTQHRRWMIRAFSVGVAGRHDPRLDRAVPGIRPDVVAGQLRGDVLAVVRAALAGGRDLFVATAKCVRC